MSSTRRTAWSAWSLRHGWLLLGGLAFSLAACGLQKQPGVSAGTTATVSSCTLSDLHAAIDKHAAGVAAGTSYLPVNFTNTSGSACSLSGFPEVAFAARATGQRIGGTAAADRSITAPRVLLAPGRTAHVWLRLVSVANLPAATCRPVTAAGLRIALSGQTTHVFLAFPATTCSKPVPNTAVLDVEPFQAGKARRHSAR